MRKRSSNRLRREEEQSSADRCATMVHDFFLFEIMEAGFKVMEAGLISFFLFLKIVEAGLKPYPFLF